MSKNESVRILLITCTIALNIFISFASIFHGTRNARVKETFHELKVNSLKLCFGSCLQHDICSSINFNQFKSQCELSKSNLTYGPSHTDTTNWNNYERREEKKYLKQTCRRKKNDNITHSTPKPATSNITSTKKQEKEEISSRKQENQSTKSFLETTRYSTEGSTATSQGTTEATASTNLLDAGTDTTERSTAKSPVATEATTSTNLLDAGTDTTERSTATSPVATEATTSTNLLDAGTDTTERSTATSPSTIDTTEIFIATSADTKETTKLTERLDTTKPNQNKIISKSPSTTDITNKKATLSRTTETTSFIVHGMTFERKGLKRNRYIANSSIQSELTVCFWLKITEFPDRFAGVFTFFPNGTADKPSCENFLIGVEKLEDSEKVEFLFKRKGDESYFGTPSLLENTLYHVCFIWGDNLVKLNYTSEENISEEFTIKKGWLREEFVGDTIVVGQDLDFDQDSTICELDDPNNCFNGFVGNVDVWSRAIDPDEVDKHRNLDPSFKGDVLSRDEYLDVNAGDNDAVEEQVTVPWL